MVIRSHVFSSMFFIKTTFIFLWNLLTSWNGRYGSHVYRDDLQQTSLHCSWSLISDFLGNYQEFHLSYRNPLLDFIFRLHSFSFNNCTKMLHMITGYMTTVQLKFNLVKIWIFKKVKLVLVLQLYHFIVVILWRPSLALNASSLFYSLKLFLLVSQFYALTLLVRMPMVT